MRRRFKLMPMITFVCLLAANTAASSEITVLPAETALAEIQKMEGVVLVDLYADW